MTRKTGTVFNWAVLATGLVAMSAGAFLVPSAWAGTQGEDGLQQIAADNNRDRDQQRQRDQGRQQQQQQQGQQPQAQQHQRLAPPQQQYQRQQLQQQQQRQGLQQQQQQQQQRQRDQQQRMQQQQQQSRERQQQKTQQQRPPAPPVRIEGQRRDQLHGDQTHRYNWNAYQQGRRPPQWQQYRRDFDPYPYSGNWRATHRYHWRPYVAPRGWYYRSWVYGEYLPLLFWVRDYWIIDYWQFGLIDPPYGFVWVRYGDDAMLVDVESGFILRVVYGVFY